MTLPIRAYLLGSPTRDGAWVAPTVACIAPSSWAWSSESSESSPSSIALEMLHQLSMSVRPGRVSTVSPCSVQHLMTSVNSRPDDAGTWLNSSGSSQAAPKSTRPPSQEGPRTTSARFKASSAAARYVEVIAGTSLGTANSRLYPRTSPRKAAKTADTGFSPGEGRHVTPGFRG